MTLTYFDSTALSAVAYDPASGTLQVQFRDGRIYEYSGVPVETHRALLGAESKGAFFNHAIRGKFPNGPGTPGQELRRPRPILS